MMSSGSNCCAGPSVTKEVVNLSAMRRGEAERLLRSTDKPICVRYSYSDDNAVEFVPEPPLSAFVPASLLRSRRSASPAPHRQTG